MTRTLIFFFVFFLSKVKIPIFSVTVSFLSLLHSDEKNERMYKEQISPSFFDSSLAEMLILLKRWYSAYALFLFFYVSLLFLCTWITLSNLNTSFFLIVLEFSVAIWIQQSIAYWKVLSSIPTHDTPFFIKFFYCNKITPN